MSRIGLFEALVRDCGKVMCSSGKYRGGKFLAYLAVVTILTLKLQKWQRNSAPRSESCDSMQHGAISLCAIDANVNNCCCCLKKS